MTSKHAHLVPYEKGLEMVLIAATSSIPEAAAIALIFGLSNTVAAYILIGLVLLQCTAVFIGIEIWERQQWAALNQRHEKRVTRQTRMSER